MKRRWIACCMALILSAMGTAGVYAEDIQQETEIGITEEKQDGIGYDEAEAVLIEDTEADTQEESNDTKQPEAVDESTVLEQEDPASESTEESMEEAATETADILAEELDSDGLIVDVEAVSAMESEEEDTERIPGGSARTGSSGRAVDASRSRLRMAGQYSGSYGEQLSGDSLRVYQAMKTQYLQNENNSVFSFRLSQPFQFQVRVDYSTGSANCDLQNNAQYQNEVLGQMNQIVQSAYDAFLYDYPEVFWLGTITYEWEIELDQNRSEAVRTATIDTITFSTQENYTGAYAERTSFKNQVNAVVAQMQSFLGTDATASDKVALIHDFLCVNLVYEENAYAWSAGGAFLHSHKVVCEGYAKAFKILCGKLGVEAALVAGNAIYDGTNYGPHMWNHVKMEDGNWYLVDVTYDDEDTAYGVVGRDYFLVGSNSIGSFPGITIGQERVIFNNLSSMPDSQCFAVPTIYASEYAGGRSAHVHVWKETGRVNATCESDGEADYQCTACLGTKREVLPALGHKYTTYVSNGNATWKSDGTKTAICDNCHVKKSTMADIGSKLTPVLRLNVSSITLKTRQSTQAVKVSGLVNGDSIKSWKSSNTALVTVTARGKITAKNKTGTTKITVTLASGLKKSFSVKVQKSAVTTTAITGVPSKLTLKKNQTRKLVPVRKPVTSTQKLTYKSSNKKIVTVTSGGVVKAKKKGKAKITITSGRKKVTCTITVK